MVGVEEAVDLLLDIAYLCVAEAAAVRNPLDRCGDILKATQEFLLCAHLIAIAPATVIIIKCNAAVLTDEDRLALIVEVICKSRPCAAVIYLRRQNLFLTFCVPHVQGFSHFLIIMQRQDIRYRVLPAVIDDHRPVWIQTLRQMVDHLRKMLLRPVCLDLMHAPGLIHRRPRNDTRMIVVLLYDLHPLPCKFRHSLIRILISRRHLTPDEHPLHVAPVKETLILDFLMFAQSVVSH